jgi:phage-related protein
MELNFYPQVWGDLQAAEPKLRATCKVHLLRLRDRQFGGIRVEKIANSGLWELKVSWNKQEFRFLFFYGANRAINFVNFFQKKTRKTPTEEIALAIARMKEMQLDQAIGVHGIPL